MQKRVLEVLKTWYFPYSAFWSAGQWGGYSPPRPPPWLRYCSLLPCLTFSIKNGQCEASTVCGIQVAGSLNRRPKGPFAVSWQRKLGE